MTTEYLLNTQLQLILSALQPENRLVCLVMLRTGLRVSDVLALRRAQLARQFYITESKTGKRFHVGLPDWLINQIRAKSRGSDWAFPSPYNKDKHRTRQAVWADIHRVAVALRVPAVAGTHSMRKVYAVDLMEKYGDIERVQRALNHGNPTVTVLYAMADKLCSTAAQRRNIMRPKRSLSTNV